MRSVIQKDGKRRAQLLRGMGYRLTPERMMILDAVQSADGHTSAEEICSQVRAKYPHLNMSTLYRTMELLKSLRLVTETDLGEGRVRYHSAEKGHHHHLVCQKCGAVFDLDEPVLMPVKDTLLSKYHFIADLRHLIISGQCLNCQG